MRPWTVYHYPSTATQATITQAKPTSGATSGDVNRLRAFIVSISAAGTASGIIEFVVRDGASGSGTVLLAGSVSVAINSGQTVSLSGLDLRSSPGNGLTVEFTGAGASATQESVWAEGDIVNAGAPAFQ